MGDLRNDAVLMLIAISLIFVYANLVLGSFSPVHFRSASAMVGLFCVFLAVSSGFAISIWFGYISSPFHNVLPFMLIGIGVDDMFVIVSCIDQIPQTLSADERFKRGLTHAGPSITITSITDALAFFLGTFSTLPALKSFCFFAGVCTITLYIGFLTIFSPWFMYDMRRMHKLKGDCCGLCCCKETTVLCCRGYFLSRR